MEIKGPIGVKVIQEPGQSGWQLLVYFKDRFKQTDLEQQNEQFQQYLHTLDKNIQRLSAGDRNREGMALILQFCYQIWPYIQKGELDLNESILIQIEQKQAVSIQDLLKRG